MLGPFVAAMRSHAWQIRLRCQDHHEWQIDRVDQEALASMWPEPVEQFGTRACDVNGDASENRLKECERHRRQQEGRDLLKKGFERR